MKEVKNSFYWLAIVSLINLGCTNAGSIQKELLIGDWVLVSGEWHDGFRINQDSVFPLINDGGILTTRDYLGQPYQLTKEDSLIIGSPVKNQWGLDKALRGFWKINKLTNDSLIVEYHGGLMSFYKK